MRPTPRTNRSQPILTPGTTRPVGVQFLLCIGQHLPYPGRCRPLPLQFQFCHQMLPERHLFLQFRFCLVHVLEYPFANP